MTKYPIFGAENEFRSASSLMAWPEWPCRPLRFYDRPNTV